VSGKCAGSPFTWLTCTRFSVLAEYPSPASDVTSVVSPEKDFLCDHKKGKESSSQVIAHPFPAESRFLCGK
jgi:hypothetical protein